mmetsp:Transcript_17662/g.32524  ORF Transcript_17662/g.32524 Transcript_17662/m.32524 type:complete len:393 (+) Transcript_17662:116-1294(+)
MKRVAQNVARAQTCLGAARQTHSLSKSVPVYRTLLQRTKAAPAAAGQLRELSGGTAQNLAVDDFFDTGVATASTPKDSTYLLPYKYRSRRARERFVLGKELGRGMFATVYQGQDRETGKNYAIKVMDKRTTPRELYERELQILEQVSGKVAHSRITHIYDVYEDQNCLYFVLELMASDMFEHIAKTGRMTEQDSAVITRKLCYALEALHVNGILHRDIKLENMLIETRKEEDEHDEGAGAFKIADFGFAKRMGESDRFQNPAGTLGYAAPEVLLQRQYGPACDVWSAGVVLYIMLAGHPPFPRKPGMEGAGLTVEEQLEAEYEAIIYGRESKRWRDHLSRGVWKDVSMPAKKLVSHMLRIDPAKRYTTQRVLNDPWILANTRLRQYEYLNFE